MVTKTYLNAEELLKDSFNLGLKILESEFRPDFIIGVWRGGTPIGIAVQEILEFYGQKSDHIAIRTSSYVGMQQQREVKVHGLEYVIDNIEADNNLLIVDDVFDSGRSIEAALRTLRKRCRRNMPDEERVKIATVYYKPLRNKTELTPDYYCYETDDWLVFPHELKDLSVEEIAENKGIKLPEITLY